MISVLSLIALGHNYMGERENIIQNNCEFDILRIKKSERMCMDYGSYAKFCNHYSQPQEFIVYNENGINGKHIVIKPYAIWEETDYNKKKLADFYYTFTCDEGDNYPKLIQHIVPMPGEDNNPLILLLFIIVIVIMILVFCPPDSSDNSNNFLLGYVLGGSGGGRRRTFCD
tara:strand:+ start:1205 stop:1717 length:513 start_codon:yes stop_codon:yes gene_type:complete